MSLLNKELIVIDDLIVKIPTCEEIRGASWDFGKDTDEIDYFSIVRIFTTNPSSMMVELDDIKIDYETLKDFELFLLLFRSLDKNTLAKKSNMFFVNTDLSNFDIYVNKETQEVFLLNTKDNIRIDEKKYNQLSELFCKMLGIKKEVIKMANAGTKRYIIERDRKKLNKQKKQNQEYKSFIDSCLLALVNNCNFKYNFKDALKLTIYDLRASLKQILKLKQVDNLSLGIYTGNISSKDINVNDLDFINLE